MGDVASLGLAPPPFQQFTRGNAHGRERRHGYGHGLDLPVFPGASYPGVPAVSHHAGLPGEAEETSEDSW